MHSQDSSFNTPSALLTDLYQLTMAYGYWKSGIANKECVFHLFFRRPPFNGGFTVAAGLQLVIEFLENFRFTESDLHYLSSLKIGSKPGFFSKDFLDYLSQLKFSCDVDAVPEGTIVFADEPILRIQGPIIECQLLESCLLNLLNFSTLIATKATRICLAAEGDSVIEFGLRRAQGMNGALTASRAAYIGGCEATSNVLAGKLYDIPVKGTHSHSWIMAFETELDSFQTYAEHLPENTIFLVDTYNTIEGIKKAIEVGKLLQSRGQKLLGIRLDSGDLAQLSIQGRRLLDDAGMVDALIVASNELDETSIGDLKHQGARIDVWGVGTHLVTAKSNPALDGVYKLSAIRNPGGEWIYKLKLSEQLIKTSNPGILQIKRFSSKEGNKMDLIYDIFTGISDNSCSMDISNDATTTQIDPNLIGVDLLVPIFRQGKRVYDSPSIHDIRKKTQDELNQFPTGIKQLSNPLRYQIGMEKNLFDIKTKLIKELLSSHK